MFDEVIIDSHRLGELPYLIKMFGVDGFQQLLESKIIKIKLDVVMVLTDHTINGKRQIPLLQFDEGMAQIQETDEDLNQMLAPLRSVPGLKGSRRDDLESLVLSGRLKFGESYQNDLLKQIKSDLTTKTALIKSLLNSQIGIINPDQVTFQVHDLGGMQRFESNLQSLMNIDREREHQIWSKVVTGVSSLNQRLADMSELSAISHFEAADAPFLFGKLHSLVSPLAPNQDEEAFLRVLSFTDLPSFVGSKRIDVEQFLKIRDTDECRLFRNWLANTDSIDDKSLAELLNGVRSKAASFITSKTGKAIRLGVNTGLGFIPGYGMFAALAEGVVDTFLLDKLLPSSGILTFLNNDMPSIFKETF